MITQDPDVHALDQLDGQRYHPQAAWILAWLSELIYQPDAAVHQQIAEQGSSWAPIRSQAGTDCGLLLTARSAVLVFRGTEPPARRGWRETLADWWANLQAAWCGGPLGIRDQVHCGYSRAVDRVLPDLLDTLLEYRGDRQLWITGHSKGGAEAQILAGFLAAEGISAAGVYSFGAPRVGCRFYAQALRQLVGTLVRHQYGADAVPLVPHLGVSRSDSWGVYQHAGDLIYFPPGGGAALFNPTWLRRQWLRWQGFRGGLFKLLGDRLADHSAANYVAACRQQVVQADILRRGLLELTPPTIQRGAT